MAISYADTLAPVLRVSPQVPEYIRLEQQTDKLADRQQVTEEQIKTDKQKDR